MQLDAITFGAMYFGGQRTPVEAGFRIIGHTVYDPDFKQHVFWFKDRATFELHRRELFEMNGHNRPVPVVKVNAEKAYLFVLPNEFKISAEQEETLLTYAKDRFDALRSDLAVKTSELEIERADFEKGKRLAVAGLELPEDASDACKAGFTTVPQKVKVQAPEQPAAPPVPPVVAGAGGAPPPPPPPPPANASDAAAVQEMAEDIFAAHGGKSIRLNDFAAKMGFSADLLRTVIENDPRFEPIPPNGWVRLKGDATPPPAE